MIAVTIHAVPVLGPLSGCQAPKLLPSNLLSPDSPILHSGGRHYFCCVSTTTFGNSATAIQRKTCASPVQLVPLAIRNGDTVPSFCATGTNAAETSVLTRLTAPSGSSGNLDEKSTDDVFEPERRLLQQSPTQQRHGKGKPD